MMSMAKRNSNTEEKWMAQVGIESALTGSECITNGREITVSSGKFPAPNKNGECAWNPNPVPSAHATAKRITPIPPIILGAIPNFDPDFV
mmetsp:Transcript_12516/g.26559  ORF Transcript_12516/g.26559 Transcript_12516/m.26559 type:complete len:90 (+) Transcript_12516:895-1164(+)